MYLNRIIIFIVFILGSAPGMALDLPHVLNNTVYDDHIKTVEMYRAGWKLSNPIIRLNSEEQLVFSFDDLSNVRRNYYYTIYHCDRQWRISKLSQQEYLDSFTDFPLIDSEYSVNTTVGYINYLLKLPNNDVPIIYSGNYALVIFDRDEPDVPLITWRFYVVEPRVTIDARIRRATFDPLNGENQEIDFRINHGSFSIQDPISDIQVMVKQNRRTDNALTSLKPMYFGNGVLEYDYDVENTFPGGNEFRFFEIRGIKYPGEGVENIEYHDPLYHATLIPGVLRTRSPYSFYKEMNGNFFIEAYQKSYPDVEADYQFVHFTLKMDYPLPGGGVYVFGQLSNWQCTAMNRMTWNFDTNCYELTMLLKQGYYNYQYAYKDDEEQLVKPENLEGSHFQTENDYQLFVYYGRITDRYDRLIGYQQFNSLLHRMF
ncbi:MAG: DUF5103 domain-containing protein [Prolixibacteraceae bacterium]|nr:DUF5103 domain-containing protein [Prolixibacteraceae bacterium]